MQRNADPNVACLDHEFVFSQVLTGAKRPLVITGNDDTMLGDENNGVIGRFNGVFHLPRASEGTEMERIPIRPACRRCQLSSRNNRSLLPKN